MDEAGSQGDKNISAPSLKSNSGEPGMFFTDRNLHGGLTYRSENNIIV